MVNLLSWGVVLAGRWKEIEKPRTITPTLKLKIAPRDCSWLYGGMKAKSRASWHLFMLITGEHDQSHKVGHWSLKLQKLGRHVLSRDGEPRE